MLYCVLFWRYLLKLSLGTLLCTLLALLAKVETRSLMVEFLNGPYCLRANMKNGDMVFDRGGELVHAIFGFCDIRNFTDCTEV